MSLSRLHVGTVDLRDRQSARRKVEPSAVFSAAYISPRAAVAAQRKSGISSTHVRDASVSSTTNRLFEQDYSRVQDGKQSPVKD